MKQYELLYIVSSKYTDAEVEGIMDKVSAMIAKHGATILRNEMIGKIRLAYPIKAQRNGSYVLVHFDMEALEANELDRELRLADEVLRHLFVERTPGAETRRYVLEAYQSPLTEEGHRRRDEKRITQSRPSATGVVAQPAMSMEELDKKLDEILEDKTAESL
ncbi:MAG: 30S ribosomal protein S6 [Patescibacteria group bacterium]